MRRVLLPSFAVCAVVLVIACVGSDPDVIVKPGGDTDASTSEASTDASDRPDGGDAASAVDGDLFRNGGFELGCDNWTDYYSTLSPDPSGRSGGTSCRVCRLTSEYYFIEQRVPRPLVPGQHYLLHAWVRAAPDKPSHPVKVVFETTNASDVVVDYGTGAQVVPGNDWAEVSGLLEVTSDAGVEIRPRIGATFAAGESCFLIDDATLVPQ